MEVVMHLAFLNFIWQSGYTVDETESLLYARRQQRLYGQVGEQIWLSIKLFNWKEECGSFILYFLQGLPQFYADKIQSVDDENIEGPFMMTFWFDNKDKTLMNEINQYE